MPRVPRFPVLAFPIAQFPSRSTYLSMCRPPPAASPQRLEQRWASTAALSQHDARLMGTPPCCHVPPSPTRPLCAPPPSSYSYLLAASMRERKRRQETLRERGRQVTGGRLDCGRGWIAGCRPEKQHEVFVHRPSKPQARAVRSRGAATTPRPGAG